MQFLAVCLVVLNDFVIGSRHAYACLQHRFIGAGAGHARRLRQLDTTCGPVVLSPADREVSDGGQYAREYFVQAIRGV
jgi:hypothetical protein